MTQHLKLFVFVKGLGTSFPVTIKRSETVGHLKQAIWKKNPNDLKHVDSNELTLYQVALTYGEEVEQLASRAKKKKLTVPSLELSEVFPTDPQEQTVSILVEVPNISK
jgi:hypothetical protein